MSDIPTARRRAIVFAGGGAKGAFEAGAVAVLAERGIDFDLVVGASAGALNAAYYAAAIRAGRECSAAKEMIDFWIDQGRWRTFLDIDLREVIGARGLSRSRHLERVLLSRMTPLVSLEAQKDVRLRMITTVLRPSTEVHSDGTSEHVFSFASDDFAHRPEKIAEAAVASAAFPGLMAPVHVPCVGDCVDGGMVANTPLAEALSHQELDEVYVVQPWGAESRHEHFSGLSLVSRWIEILLDERFNRELALANRREGQRRALAELRDSGELTPRHHDVVQEALDLPSKTMNVVLIRPEGMLPGNILSAFGDRSLRIEYITRGKAAAERALGLLSVTELRPAA
jgi:predicted acylesterase/phospholipase RssA